MVPPSAPTTPTSPFPQPGALQPSSLSRLTLSDKLLLAQAVHHIGSSPPDWGRVSSVLLSHPLIKTKARLEQAAKAGITLGRVFGSRECERAWVALMRQYNLVVQPGEKGAASLSFDHGVAGGESGEGAALASTASQPLPPSSSSTTTSSSVSTSAQYADGSVAGLTAASGSPATPRTKEARGFPPKVDRASQLALAQFLYAERILEIQESIKAKEAAFKALVKEIDALNAGTLDDKLLDKIESTIPGQEQALVEQANKEVAVVDGMRRSSPAPPGAPAGTGPAIRGRNSRGGSVTNLPIVSPTRPLPMPDLRLSEPSSPTQASHSERGVNITAEADEEEPSKPAQDSNVTKAEAEPHTTSKNVLRIQDETGDKNDGDHAQTMKATEHEESAKRNTVTLDKHEEREEGRLEGNGDVRQRVSSVDSPEEGSPNSSTEEPRISEDAASDAKRKRGSDDEGFGVEAQEQHKRAKGDDAVLAHMRASTSNVAGTKTSEDRSESREQITSDMQRGNSDESGEEESEEETEAPASTTATKAEGADSDTVGEARASLPDDKADAQLAAEQSEAEQDEDLRDEEDSMSPKRLEPRRSRRSVRNVEGEETGASTTPTSGSLTKKDRVGALRSRQTSGTSAEAEDEQDGESSRSTVEPGSRTSTSPVSGRRPRGGARRSSTIGTGSRRGRRESTTTNLVGDETASDVERERERAAQAAQQRKNEKVLMMLLNEVSNHTHGNLFHAPIRESDAPDYYALVRRPMDLKTIKARIKDGRIATATQLRRALSQMFANSLIYNRPGTEVHRMAMEMRDAAERMLDQFEQTQRSAGQRRR